MKQENPILAFIKTIFCYHKWYSGAFIRKQGVRWDGRRFVIECCSKCPKMRVSERGQSGG